MSKKNKSLRWTQKDLDRFYGRGVPVPPKTKDHSAVVLGTPRPSKMNKTESRYAQTLELLKHNGEILNYWYESIQLKIGDGRCWYFPDFLVFTSDYHFELHEVKGSPRIFRDDAKVKAKVCATNYPIPLYIVYPEGNGWRKELIC